MIGLITAIAMTLTMTGHSASGVASPRPTPPREIIAQIYSPAERNRLSAVKSFIMTGSATLGKQHGTVTTYWKAPNKFVIQTKYTDESGSYAIGFDGHKGWFAYPNGVIEGLRPQDEAPNDCSGMWLSNSDWFPDRWPTIVNYVGWTMIQGAPAILVDVKLKMCGTTRYTFDSKTLREIYQNRHPDGRIFVDRYAPTVRGPNGLTFQAYHKVTLRASSVTGSIWYNALRVNVPLDDELFEFPRCWGQCRS